MAQPFRLPARRLITASNVSKTRYASSRVTCRTYATDNNDPKKVDFKEQLWQSSTDRAIREREEQTRFAQQRSLGYQGTGPAGLFGAVVIAGILAYVAGSMNRNPAPTEDSTVPLEKSTPPKHDTSERTLQAAWADFKAIVGADNVSTNEADLHTHAGSSWSSHPTLPGDVPFAIVRPATTEEVSEVMKVCHRRKIPVTAYSGGTSLEGHFAATRGGICIDFSRMDQILALHEEDLDCVVQPAVGWQDLNELLAEKGLYFPPDPGPGAMIGGMVGTGCSGTNAYRYGTMRDWVLSLTVVLADGTILKTRQRPRKTSAGYDLTRLFIGSEGTLGLVTEATLKITSAPQNVRVALATFGSVKDAASCVYGVVRKGVSIAAVELLDDAQMKCVNDSGSTTRKWKEAPTLLFKFSGTPSAVKESIAFVQKEAKINSSKSFEFASSAEECDELWQARKDALWSVMAKKRVDSDKVWTTDVAVPISKLPEIVDKTKEDLSKSGLIGTVLGHVGDGNFHCVILYNDTEREVVEGVVHRMVKRAIDLEGTSTGEHGVGLVKRDYLEHELGKDTVNAMRAIKKAWDPLCLLNCDKIIRTQIPKPGEIKEW